MTPITHDSSSKKLGKQVATYNDAIEQHHQNEGAISQPPAIPDDELPTITIGTLQTHRDGLRSETLQHLQNGVNLGRQRIELLEEIETELTAKTDSADSDYLAIHQRVAATLEKSGMGVAHQPAARHNYTAAAERQFEVLIRQSADVQNAEREKKHARGNLAQAVKQTHQAKAALQDSLEQLRLFVITTITGNHHEKKHPGQPAKFVG